VDFELCEDEITISSDPVVVDVIDITVDKEASCAYAVVGSEICYTITITTDTAIDGMTFKDLLDPAVEYVVGSFEVNGDPEDPVITGQEISYELDLPIGETVIEFCVEIKSVPVTPEP